MDYDKNYIGAAYNPEKSNEIFIKGFIRFRKENNLTQDLFSKYSGVSREKLLELNVEHILHQYLVYLKY